MSVQEPVDVIFDAPPPSAEAPPPPTDAEKPAGSPDEKAQEQEQGKQDDAAEEARHRDDKGRFKGVQGRIDELTRQKYEAEREAAYWKGRAGLDTKQDQAQPSAEQAATTKPTPDKFDDYGSYIEALTEWKADQKINQALTEREAKAAAARQAETVASTWEQRQAAARATVPDYDAVVGGADAPVAQHVAEALMDSERGPELAYHLAKNPEVLARLNSLPQRQADRELGRIEASLSAPAAAPAAPPARTTQAPTPAATTLGQGRATTPNPSDMSMDEYVAFRSKGQTKARWAR